MTVNFTKVQGAGNDFILIEAGNMDADWPGLARAMCDRHFGVGGDGLLVLLPSVGADFRMRMFNPDGSEAEACGNGLRCLARYVLDRGMVKAGADRISVETGAEAREVEYRRGEDRTLVIRLGMGVPVFCQADIPVALEAEGNYPVDQPVLNYPVMVEGHKYPMSFVSMGNPHAVYFSPQPVSSFPLAVVGPEVEINHIFPRRTNFEVAHIAGPDKIEVRVWERGAGETLACGTGACAVAVIAHLHGYIGDNVDIILPGGVLTVEWAGVGEVYLSGPAELVFTGEWPET